MNEWQWQIDPDGNMVPVQGGSFGGGGTMYGGAMGVNEAFPGWQAGPGDIYGGASGVNEAFPGWQSGPGAGYQDIYGTASGLNEAFPGWQDPMAQGAPVASLAPPAPPGAYDLVPPPGLGPDLGGWGEEMGYFPWYNAGNYPGAASVNTYMGGVFGEGGSFWHGGGRGAPPVLGGGGYGYFGLGGGGPIQASRYRVGEHELRGALTRGVIPNPGGYEGPGYAFGRNTRVSSPSWAPWQKRYQEGSWDPFRYPHGGTAEGNAAWLAAHGSEEGGGKGNIKSIHTAPMSTQ